MLKNKTVLFFTVSFVLLLFDQLSKFFADRFLPLVSKIDLPFHFISFEKVYNTGAAFSIMQNDTFLIIAISLITIFIIGFWVIKKQNTLNVTELLAFACISGGAAGNLIDRCLHSYVIDFIQLEFVKFPIFNFADIFINIGVIILILYSFRFRHE